MLLSLIIQLHYNQKISTTRLTKTHDKKNKGNTPVIRKQVVRI
jgi:hypothetical protein